LVFLFLLSFVLFPTFRGKTTVISMLGRPWDVEDPTHVSTGNEWAAQAKEGKEPRTQFGRLFGKKKRVSEVCAST
jgi:hypothetical protein